MWAIIAGNVGEPVGARQVDARFTLVTGEFAVSDFDPSYVYGGGTTVRAPTAAETLNLKRAKASLSRMDFMLALNTAGILAQAQALAKSTNISASWQIMWENAGTFDRLHPDLVAGAQQLGITDAQLDAIFGI